MADCRNSDATWHRPEPFWHRPEPLRGRQYAVTGKFARGRYQGCEAWVWSGPSREQTGKPSDVGREERFVKTLTVEEVYLAAYVRLREDAQANSQVHRRDLQSALFADRASPFHLESLRGAIYRQAA
jgi:hypothetical protein